MKESILMILACLLIVYLLINSYYLFTACRVVVGSSFQSEGVIFPIQESIKYRDGAEEDFVNVTTSRMGEDTIQTATYDEKWTEGTLRIPQESFGEGYIELPVHYEKGGTWKIDAEAAPEDYQEYIYYLFNR